MRIRLQGHELHIRLILLWITESLAVVASCWLACASLPGGGNDEMQLVHAAVYGGCIMASMVAMGLFTRRLRDRMAGILLRITISVTSGTVVTGLALGPWVPDGFTLAELAAAAAMTWCMLAVVRITAGWLISEDVFRTRVMVYGAGVAASRLLQLRRRADQRGFRVIGFMPVGEAAPAVPAELLLREHASISQLVRVHDIDEIVVALDDRRQNLPLQELLDCRLRGTDCVELATFLERETGRMYLDIVNPSWMIFGGGFRRDLLRRLSERCFDLLASSVLLLLASPLLLAVAIAIKLEEGWRAPVFYAQERVGYAGHPFRLLKMRSMRVDAEGDGRARWAQANDSRVTRVGALIRRTRIDELPQLLAVLRGKMSFVGPRPERPEFVEQLAARIPYYRERHSVKPGLTGWAQLCYPYGASEQDAIEKLQYDLYYVKHHSLLFDFVILLQTVEVVLLGKGVR